MVETPIAVLVEQLGMLGVRRDGVLLVHSSFRAIRPVEGGPSSVIAALRQAIGDRGTLVMPAMTDGESPFDPASTPTFEMGVVPELFWRKWGVLRSTHPGGSFAAAGPAGEQICAPQPLEPLHGPDSPVGRVHQLGGQVLLLGVGHDANTTLHLAEALAKVPYSVTHPCVVVVDGAPRTIEIAETDHCCRNFALADGWLRSTGAQREGPFGHAHARLMESTAVVETALRHLGAQPLVFLCAPAARCGECDRARASVG